MSLAQITEKIRNDAQKEADEILSKAKEQADSITKKAGEECDGIKADFDARFDAERPEILKRREIVANLDILKMQLRARRDLINDVYSGALAKMAGMSKDKYLEFCVRLLGEAVVSGDESVVVSAEEKYINAQWLASYNESHGTKLKLSEEKAEISGGFILVRDRTRIDASWDMLLKVLQEKQESDVVKRLFPAE